MFKRLGRHRAVAGLTIVAIAMTFVLWGMSKKVTAVTNNTYESLKIFTDVLSIVQSDYAENVDSKKLVYSAVKGMVKDLDPHSSFMTPEEYSEMQVDTKGVFGGIGIEIGMKEGMLTVIAPIDDTPASHAGLLAGDKIVKIGDKYTKDMTITEAVGLMRGPVGTSVTISIMRESFDVPKSFTFVRATIKVKSVKYKSLSDGLGYVKITQFQENTSSELDKALKEIKPKEGELRGLVLDLRNNPGGLLQEAVGVSRLFVNSGLIVYTKGRGGSQDMTFKADGSRVQPDYPIIVLVNGGSASASEIVAGALQDHKRAVILGTLTFGKGSVQTIVPLSDGSAVRLTTSKYYTPSGRSIQAKGIEPDIVVGETPKGYLKEKDLTGHLVADGAREDVKPKKDAKDAKSDDVKKAHENNDKPKKAEEGAKGEDGEDIQLNRAVDYLKSWYIFKERMPKAS